MKDFTLRPETTQFLEENRDGKFFGVSFGNNFFGYDSKKSKQLQLPQTEKLLHSKGSYQQNEKAIY